RRAERERRHEQRKGELAGREADLERGQQRRQCAGEEAVEEVRYEEQDRDRRPTDQMAPLPKLCRPGRHPDGRPRSAPDDEAATAAPIAVAFSPPAGKAASCG